MSESDTASQEEAIVQFCGITGADEERARGLLEACQWNLELAINTHVDCDPEGRSRQGAQSSTSATSGAAAATTAASSTNSNSNHRNFAVHNDDDEDTDEGLDDSRAARLISARPIDPVARRLNATAGTSSSFSSSAPFEFYDQDGVRPPIAPVRQILNPNPIGYPTPEMPHVRRYNTRIGSGVAEVAHDAFRDFQAEAQWHEMAQEGESNTAVSTEGSRRTIDELFRPPLELMFRGSLASARENGTQQNRWLLVNIQNGREFACQILNRDVWSNQTVRDIIKEHFIFWQVYHDSYEGSRYVQFYNAKKLPHVAIIDPRTGELMKLWPASIDQTSFCDSVIEFLTEHPSPDGSADANSMKKLRVKEGDEAEDDEPQIIPPPRATFYDQSEEAQLEAAIKASLRETEKVETNDDTIEIDEDTIEEIDIIDPKQTARDKEPTEKSSPQTEQNNSKPKSGNSFQAKLPTQPPRKFPSSNRKNETIPKQPANNNIKQEDQQQQPTTTVAESLKAMAAKRPVKIEGPECRIALRFPDGSSLVQTFSANEQLAGVKEFVQMGKTGFDSSRIEFVAPPNRKLAESNMGMTLEGLGLCPASRLEVKCILD